MERVQDMAKSRPITLAGAAKLMIQSSKRQKMISVVEYEQPAGSDEVRSACRCLNDGRQETGERNRTCRVGVRSDESLNSMSFNWSMRLVTIHASRGPQCTKEKGARNEPYARAEC